MNSPRSLKKSRWKQSHYHLRSQREIKENTKEITLLFLDIGFKYERYLCNGYHDLMQNAINFIKVAIVSIKRSDCRTHFWYLSKDDAINIIKNSTLNEKRGLL